LEDLAFIEAVLHPHQEFLVMPDDGAQSVVALINSAHSLLLLKQCKLDSAVVLDALHRAKQR
jgi:hypothetical protein